MQKPSSQDISPVRKRPQVLLMRYAFRPFSRKKRIIAGAGSLLVLLLLGAIVWYQLGYSSRSFIDASKYQALFTTNNQAYFGKLQLLSDGSYRMTGVYYLQQSGTTAQKANTDDQTPQLVKMGSELHGPEDAVVFPAVQVQFWENLKSDGKVAKAIDAYLKK